MGSQRRTQSTLGKGNMKSALNREQDIGVVEVDATFGRMLVLTEGQKVGILVHLDPPLAHTVNIEPLTAGDWEIIELHANFLEVNLIAQIRALPNPLFTGMPSIQAQQAHPLTLHLSPTSTANIIVTSLTPPLIASVPFAKLAPDAEVIVAPKTRPRPSRTQRTESRSNASVGQRSTAGRSVLGLHRPRSHREEVATRKAVFLRGLDWKSCAECFNVEDQDATNSGLKVWVDRDVLIGQHLMGLDSVCVSIIEPPGTQAPLDAQQQQKIKDQENSEVGKHATKVAAKLSEWADAPDTCHVVLSSSLCAAFGVERMAGGIVKLETPPAPIASNSVTGLKVYPFTQPGSRPAVGIRFGGESKASREAAAEKLKTVFGGNDKSEHGILSGPLTDGLILPKSDILDSPHSWNGGILRFDPLIRFQEGEKPGCLWLLGSNLGHVKVEVQHDTINPVDLRKGTLFETEPLSPPLDLVGIRDLTASLKTHLVHQSSVLLTGGIGSGKTSLASLIAHRLRQENSYHVSYFPCRKLIADEIRVSTIKETLNRIFTAASWGARMGGASLVILDDLDRICPAETELQVGGENGRSRQLSELICSTVRQYCDANSDVVLLMTVQSKDSLNSIILGGHVVRATLDIKAPNKDTRRLILQSLAHQEQDLQPSCNEIDETSLTSHEGGWMEGSLPNSRPPSADGSAGFKLSPGLDLLEVAGQTDGYMPGDLAMLLSRARSEALIRSSNNPQYAASRSIVSLFKADFEQALKGFTPASLRNVTLQTSSTTFDSIGGLHDTRRILLETLQYPTTYAPIFAQCPLRLRSGLLLYGYPGCGKTLLASAVAGECGLNFISVKGPEILNKYIGASEKSVRDLFERAEAARPCVLFFDEFDSIAPKRGHDSTGVTDRVVNQLLTQMDGAEGLSGVYVLAATSRPDLIDPALLRPGRLDKSLICDLPTFDDRRDILRALSKKLTIDPSVIGGDQSHENLNEIASRTKGYSGADLQAVIYNAHLEAIHDVLGDHKGTVPEVNGTKGLQKQSTRGTTGTGELIQFRYGENEDRQEATDRESSGINRAKQVAERAALVTKFNAMKLAKRREKALRHGLNAQIQQNGEKEHSPEIVIRWKHIEASLATTRSSISSEEARKLGNIYREFQVGRNGEMPNGQGGMEIGGRSSLM